MDRAAALEGGTVGTGRRLASAEGGATDLAGSGGSVSPAGSSAGSRAAEHLVEQARHGAVSHAYLFTGPPGLGQQRAALMLAQTLNCTAPEPDERPCGACPPCLRISAATDPRVRILVPEKTRVRISEVRDLLKNISLAAADDVWQVLIFTGCDTMTLEAANRLLKVLEEPPPRTVLILLAASADPLPETIVSRCRLIPFRSAGEANLVPFLREELDLDARGALSLARLSMGNPTKARELHEAGALGELRDAIFQVAFQLAGGRAQQISAAAACLDELGDGLPIGLLLLDALWRDVRLFQGGVGAENFYLCDVSQQVARLAAKTGPIDLEELITVTNEARRSLEARAIRKLALQVACLRMAAALR